MIYKKKREPTGNELAMPEAVLVERVTETQ